MDIELMPAGPKLDVLVATEVMGWRRGDAVTRHPKYPLSLKETPGRWYNGGEELDRDHATPEGDGGGDYYVPDESWSPSTDIRAAWEVAATLGGWRLRVDPVRDGSGRKHYSCYFYAEQNYKTDALNVGRAPSDPIKWPEPREPWHTTIDDAPLAICRAALAAVRAAR